MFYISNIYSQYTIVLFILHIPNKKSSYLKSLFIKFRVYQGCASLISWLKIISFDKYSILSIIVYYDLSTSH